MAMIAVHCAKTITVAAAGSDFLRSCSRLLLPALVQYIARLSSRLDDDTLSEQHCASIEEVYKTFAALLLFVTEEKRKGYRCIVGNLYSRVIVGTRVLCVILPTITLLLRPSRIPLAPVHSSAVSQLLSLAASSPTFFKEAAVQLDPKIREMLEVSIRRAVEGTSATTQSVNRPQISLRSF